MGGCLKSSSHSNSVNLQKNEEDLRLMTQKEIRIKVGIKTQGEPVVKPQKSLTLVENMLIGDGFHWQSVIQAVLPGEVIPYSGTSENSENVSLINSLPLETYLECVVGSEMNPAAPMEFLKAHAVISRSWALGKILGIHHEDSSGKINSSTKIIGWDDTASHHNFHVCSDDHCQRYQGLQNIPLGSLLAIRETHGEVLISQDGHLIDTRFSKCCGGTTELFSTCWQSMDAPSLQSFPDPWCDLSSISSVGRRSLLSTILKDYDQTTADYGYRWLAKISKIDIKKNLLKKFGREIGDIESIEPLHRGPSGRIDMLRINGSRGSLEIGKELYIRRLLSPSHLYSSAFDIEDCGDFISLKGKGWGHGVGLCQIGAAHMAFHGYSYKDILSLYYPGSILSREGFEKL